jgi:hypothetical protein
MKNYNIIKMPIDVARRKFKDKGLIIDEVQTEEILNLLYTLAFLEIEQALNGSKPPKA